MIEATFQPLIPLADIGVGRMRSCKVGEREVVVCHTKDGVFTVDNVCTHAFARMSEGYLKGTRITCPLHGASFDVRTGRVLGGPATLPLATFETRVTTAGQVEIALPTEAGAR
jgi:nitrite reductase/ring-hydroxylating ferredoxin subunit